MRHASVESLDLIRVVFTLIRVWNQKFSSMIAHVITSHMTNRRIQMKMKPQTIPSLFFTALIVLLLRAPTYSCQDDQARNRSCGPPLECGNIKEIGYPFWGGPRPGSCGLPGFQLTCRNNTLILNTSSIPYRLLDIDTATQTLRVSRDDLSNTLCAPLLRNTTLDPALFDFSAAANDRNVTLYYGCDSIRPPPPTADRLNCSGVSGSGNGSFYLAMEEAAGGACGGSINVPVSQGAARGLRNRPGNVPADVVLQDAFARGFSVQWSVNNDCRNCVGSGGSCEHSNQSFICYCADGPHSFTCNDTTHTSSTNGTSHSQTYLIIGLSLGLPSGIAISFIAIFCIKKRCHLRTHDQEGNQDIDKVLLHHGSLAPKRYTYNQIKKMTKSFSEKLGRGAFGIVYKGKLPEDGQLVAVKLLTETDDNIPEDFVNEVSSISKTSHVNIVNLLGFCYERNKRALVYEFMPNKSLDNFMTRSRDKLGWDKMYEIAVGVARGLEYLHRGCSTRIVHFDIKPQNILLDEDMCPKISDFGLAKLFRKKQSMVSMLGARGTVGYIAPEVFSRSFGVVSHKSDVYSYGMMLLEMAGAKKAVERGGNESGEIFFHDRIYEGVLVEEEEEEEEVVRKMLLVGVWCIQIMAADRPSMTKVVEMLEGKVESIQVPPKPVFPSPIASPQSSSSSWDSVSLEIE